MSLGYADRLSHREDLGGRLGDPELFDAPHVLLAKAERLAELVSASSKIIAFTGAGISTACGIPDFRGPQGVWTLQRAGRPPPQLATSFLFAQPSLTHMALLGLLQAGKLSYICSQNVDSLHLRSGVPRFQLAELHGNCFAERCPQCKREYVRDFEMDTVGFKPTGRRCAKPGCRGELADHILDWEDALPPAELRATEQHASAADLAICLGTSLQIIPAANLPLRTVRGGGRLAIINLQATPKDRKADVVAHGKVDQVMALVMSRAGLPIPVFTRSDSVVLGHDYTPAAAAAAAAATSSDDDEEEENGSKGSRVKRDRDDMSGISGAAARAKSSSSRGSGGGGSGSGGWGFSFSIQSVHGPSCPLPMVASARVSFTGRGAAAATESGDGDAAAAVAELLSQELSGELPWKLARSCPGSCKAVTVRVELRLVAAADEDKRSQQLQYVISRPPAAEEQEQQQQSGGGRVTRRTTRARQQQQQHSQVLSFVSQVRDYSRQQQELVSQLEAAAEASSAAAGDADAGAAAAVGAAQRGGKGSGSGAAAGCSGSSSEQQQQKEEEEEDDDDDEDEDVGSSEVEDDEAASSGASSDVDAGATAGASSDSDYDGTDSGAGRRSKSRRPTKRARPLDL